MGTDALEQARPDSPGGESEGRTGAGPGPDRSGTTPSAGWGAVTAMVGGAVAEQGPARHPRLRRVAEPKGRDREDGGTDGPELRSDRRRLHDKEPRGGWVGLRSDHHG